MKKSIKTAALGLLALGMLAGCSKEAPVKSKWSKAEDESIREVLYGQSLPYVSGVKDLQLETSTKFGEVSISGGKATPKVLEKYAAKFTSEEGWYSLDEEEEENVAAAAFKAEEEPVLSYNFEKEVETLEGTRFITVQFGSVGEDSKFVVDGDFRLIANDPYLYEFPSDYLSAAIASIFASTVEVPEIDARRYVWDDEKYVVYCDIPNGTTVEADYKAALEKEGWVVWFDDLNELWTANAPDKAFSIYYIYEEGTMLIGLYTVENEPSEVFPEQYFAQFYMSSGVHALVDLPDYTIASETGYFLSDFSNMSYGIFTVYALESTRDEMMTFVEALEVDGWTCEADEYEDYDCTKAFGYSLVYLKVSDYATGSEEEGPYIQFDATVYANYLEASSFPVPASYFTSAGYAGAQIAPYATITFDSIVNALETILGVQYDSESKMFYLDPIQGESLLDATQKLVANFPSYFEENTAPVEKEDDDGNPMGYADYYVADGLFGVEVDVFEFEPYAAAIFVYEFSAKFEYTVGFTVDDDSNILNAYEVDIYGSSVDEMTAYKEAMEALGWTFVADEYGDFNGTLESVPGVMCYIGDYLELYGCIIVQYSYVANAYTAYNSLTAVFGEGMPISASAIMFYVEAGGTLESVLSVVSSFVPAYTVGYSSVQALPDSETGEPTEEMFGLGQYYALDGSFGIEIQVFDNSENAGEGSYAAAIYFVLL